MDTPDSSASGAERANVPVLREPKDEEWGARTFDLLDPFGNTIFVMGPLRDQASPIGKLA